MGMKLALDLETAEVLRVFADQMPRAIDRIDAATEKLLNVYAQVEGTVGIHEPKFEEMLKRLAAVQKQAREPILKMPHELNQLASDIEDFVKASPELGSYSGN